MRQILFLLTLLAFLVPARLCAFESGGIYYTTAADIDNNGNPITVAVVTSSPDGYSGDIVIPSTVEYEDRTLPVTAIGDYAFRDCRSLTCQKKNKRFRSYCKFH